MFPYLIAFFLFATPLLAQEKVGRVATRGLLIKDHIEVSVFDDPEVPGISCYVTGHNRSLSITDGSDAAISCVQTGAINITPTSNLNVFSQSKSLIFKSTVVSRFYDPRRHTLVYLVYTVSTDEGNNAHAISVVPIKG
jgi:CreA protein